VNDPRQIRSMLGEAPGYAVIDRHGKRIGAFGGLAGGDRIAIRHDGIFVWHRRLLPITAVASVIPDQRAVVLTVDERAVSESEARPASAPASSGIAKEDSNRGGVWQNRISGYVEPVEDDPHEADSSRAETVNEPPPQTSETRTRERHLLFLSSAGSGYSLLEREGPPPPLGDRVEVPEQPTPFAVLKLATSPLPNDDRICVYLEPVT
jgi:hypothetical protein